MDDSVRLLTTQQQLEKEVDGKIKFFGLSVNETIRSLIMNGLNKKAEKVRGDWKVSEKRYVVGIARSCAQSLIIPLQVVVRQIARSHCYSRLRFLGNFREIQAKSDRI
jgi:hypothetical protein